MNYFIRYLDHITTDPSLKSDWIGKWTPKNGFSSRGGSERDTTGILLWSQPFVIKVRNDFLKLYANF
jgi:atlastin